MAKQYNPWTGFLEDTAAKANDAAPVVGKKYTINGKEFKVLEVKGDNVKVLGSNGIVNHLNIRMFDEKPTIDKAIRSCDKIEFDPQDIRSIKKAIGSLKVANSLLGMINEKTVNNAKQNIASTISLLESIR